MANHAVGEHSIHSSSPFPTSVSNTLPEALEPTPSIPKSLRWKLYTSHFLSTWNSRSFEFGSVLFLSRIYWNTLLYLSIYAMVRSASAILFSSTIGHAIDRRARIQVVRASIVAARLGVSASAFGFWILLSPAYMPVVKDGIFAVLIMLACIEKLASTMNLISIERDWVVVITQSNEPMLQKLNANMRRIDLICKLAGPLFIALVDGASTMAAIWITLALNLVSLPIEYYAIGSVHTAVPELHELHELDGQHDREAQVHATHSCTPGLSFIVAWFASLKSYFSHPAMLPSFSLALLYLTVLSFSGQMVTFLIMSGFNSFHIALTRSLSTIAELSATWIAPLVMSRISPTRGGMWFLSWQILWLMATISFFFFFYSKERWIVAASGLAAGTIVSRVGLWGFDLCAQTIVQTEVQESNRGSFSSTEAMFQNLFELLSFALTIAFPSPRQFGIPVLVSVVATTIAGVLFASFLRKRRGHLLHVPCTEVKRNESN